MQTIIHDDFSVSGTLMITETRADGTVKIHPAKNLIVFVGKAFIASRMVGTASNIMSHMAVGSGITAPASTDTTLVAELGRVALASGVASGATVTYIANFPAGTGTGSLNEAGIFNSSGAGTMLCRTTFPTIVKAAGSAISITWTVSLN